jgi:type IV pilus assembly protein PilQ
MFNGISSKRVAAVQLVPEEGIMPKHFKNVAVRTCALACVAGLSLNSFAFAVAASAKTTRKSASAARTTMPAQPDPSPTPVASNAANTPAKDNMTTQGTEGRRYGQLGFAGEPINLNVVNADVRDILNYITEQYGINFVIDSSVKAVPVTVNVQDVPWNYALDAILRANKLGIDVSGNILRVATTETLTKEAEMQRLIRDAQLTNAPLVTEFIRLNYARASGTLAQAAGSTSAFAGGSTNMSFSGGAGGDYGGSGGDQGLLPIIKRRLSRLGSVEVEGRSNTLIITDVKENIDAIRQLVAILDQPEPQVEIETRIVIAQRSFSRDLGAQLSLGVAGLNRGSLANVSSLPASGSTGGSGSGGSGGTGTGPTLNSGPNPFSAFGGLANTAMPLNDLRAAAANTVIGLTTGMIGTAQISLLVSAAENRGEVKTVATPRITALNNRPAQIESGSQIPVQTTQAAGGTAVVTTTFVSVPLRLSITPQITDAGTVVLRVTIENNTVNTGIAVGGVPGIDTQRMQSEVLVPDGGTTVMGGVLADQDATTRQRTPGVASIPIIGNLFKRKLVTKNSTEILFFITPHIYRPDYFGRPTNTTPQSGPRTQSVPQPVPLGNPQTNTSTPNESQQPEKSPATSPQPNVLGAPTNPATPASGTARPGAVSGERPD